MAISFQAVTLDSDVDSAAMLVFSDGRLTAIVSQLSDLHPGLEGRWYVEASYDPLRPAEAAPFVSLDAVRDWATARSG